jgi:DNA-binding transcriptional ArsR family regulator
VSANLSHIGRLLAAPARCAMLDLMLDGRPHTAGELAASAAIQRPATSEHLAALVAGGLVRAQATGRRRYFELADQRTAEALEMLGNLCPETPVRSLRAARTRRSLQLARTCYDHLAGRLGVELYDAMVSDRWLDRESLRLTGKGTQALRELGIHVSLLRQQQRTFTRPCRDWTEKRMHLAGAVGASLADLFFRQNWVARRQGTRALKLTQHGVHALRTNFGVTSDGWVDHS